MGDEVFAKPFDGAISAYYGDGFPAPLRRRIRDAKKGEILADSYPHESRMDSKAYEKRMAELQIELVKLQYWARASGARIAVVFEGRDAAGKGGSIKRFTENLNPRGARVVALSKPSDIERGQWYFQRYIQHLPGPGEIVLFDRSWYNRAVVERVFGFSSDEERALFYEQVNEFEHMLVKDGIRFFKIWLTVSRAEQMRRMLAREADPLKQWKLSTIDVEGLRRWNDYSVAITDMFRHTHSVHAPWHVVRADDKRRARIATQQVVLSAIEYEHRDKDVAQRPDSAIVAGPEIMPAGES
ncbi:polyphosphate kinase 2 [Limibaculum sp. M0105]|uniref:ADP/GDP-polyphosphate phosphotransferase n=1 Tax=Thermohalobaculum xanthum TaxID=2753746 RepID=A0A8J7SEF7_9RHOB|nr:polyphosphate kinase 2 [Thermohalobaculum xanthum]MBK0398922.1 polyphosphate kinase 2 [Thermohalobaculum xanthum]